MLAPRLIAELQNRELTAEDYEMLLDLDTGRAAGGGYSDTHGDQRAASISASAPLPQFLIETLASVSQPALLQQQQQQQQQHAQHPSSHTQPPPRWLGAEGGGVPGSNTFTGGGGGECCAVCQQPVVAGQGGGGGYSHTSTG